MNARDQRNLFTLQILAYCSPGCTGPWQSRVHDRLGPQPQLPHLPWRSQGHPPRRRGVHNFDRVCRDSASSALRPRQTPPSSHSPSSPDSPGQLCSGKEEAETGKGPGYSSLVLVSPGDDQTKRQTCDQETPSVAHQTAPTSSPSHTSRASKAVASTSFVCSRNIGCSPGWWRRRSPCSGCRGSTFARRERRFHSHHNTGNQPCL